MDTPVPSLYIHVPFCSHKCEYCAFYSELLKPEQVQRFVESLCGELKQLGSALQPRTIFFGGGTPSILSLHQWETILDCMHGMGWGQIPEWTVECNPATVSKEKAQLLKQGGVNRISMGVQSMDAHLLERLGRIHSREQVFCSFEILRGAGFENINLDLMFGIPGQDLKIWHDTLDTIHALNSEHLSAYEVIYEDDTPLFHQMKAGAFDVDEDLIESMYESLIDRSTAAGYHQYEVANFARNQTSQSPYDVPHWACQHNIHYWRAGDYHAAGPSSTEYVQGVRRQHVSNTSLYCDGVQSGGRGIVSEETLIPPVQQGEWAAFAMRMNQGLDFKLFEERFGHHPTQLWGEQMQSIQSRGLAVVEKDHFRPTPLGMRFADAVGSEFVYLQD